MIQIIEESAGNKLSDTVLDATITDSGGEALVTTAFTHSLTDGNWVYIQSNFESYNGYKYVLYESPTTFKITDAPALDPTEYQQDADIEYQVSIYRHRAMAVHNPIVYTLKSDYFPTNEVDAAYVPAVVSSQENDNGYTKLILSGNLTDPTALAWITIDGTAYQIIRKISDSIVVINLAYDAANTFPGPVLRYLNNYCINVEVWCGYEPTHPWVSKKPYELAATLKFTPDENNEVKFSISEIVKSYIITRNKLDLDTLPNNIDFSCGFYISHYESYDQSDGTEITTYNGPHDTELLINAGLAVNAMMPFKSIDAGAMSEYVTYNNFLAKWLVLQDSMTWIVGKFMDLSFLTIGFRYPQMEIRSNGEILDTIDFPGNGVIRIPLTFDTSGTYCIAMYRATIPATPSSSFIMGLFGEACGSNPWVPGTPPTVTLPAATESGYTTQAFSSFLGINYDFTYTVEILVSAGVPVVGITVALLDADCNVLDSQTHNYFTAGIKTDSVTLSPDGTGVYVGITINNITPANSKSFEFQSFQYAGAPELAAAALTEEICITVVDECDSTILPEDVRLLEDGSFRLLE